MKRKLFFKALIIIFCLTVFLNNSNAAQIGSGAFGPGAQTESFEGLSSGPNIPFLSSYPSYLLPGSVSPYTFVSGVTLTSPIPNPDASDGNILIGDFNLSAGATWGLAGNGIIASAADVPFGSAYLGINDDNGTEFVEFTFSSDMLRVGAYVTGVSGSSITLSAFDGSGTLLETYSMPSVHISNWGTNFLGIENAAGIRRVRFTGDFYPVIDGLTFEQQPNAAVPAMNQWGMIIFVMLAGIVAVYFIRRQRRIET